ncbi:MAG: peptidoglycan-binding protein [Alphaproteobacteria bacterium]|nr:peptidoglycan-binding protein [Alphaproteobacteria bacterium]MBU0797399.1 peptidoglycan-binding protein [Alphaproteobacteria bacterium]MBU0887090.1 peptidoglycan-binding protein [Alphaproteobacteria bacterium]MBU1814340.1 peptidoglycan-binding protein [Alphaproteobacteria bacterium]
MMRRSTAIQRQRPGLGWLAAGAIGATALWAFAGPALAMPAVPASTPTPSTFILAQAASELPPEMRTALLRGIQEELNEKGFSAGSVDGVMGSRTRSAIQTYQRKAGLPVNGVPTKELLDHLKFSTPAVTASTSGGGTVPKVATTDKLTTDVQRELRRLGYYAGGIDGVYGPATRQAIERYQYDYNKSVNGNVSQPLLEDLRDRRPVSRTGTRT